MKPIEAWNKNEHIDIIWIIINSNFRQELKKEISMKFDSNLIDKQSLHHVTLYFKPKQEQIENIKKWATENESILINIEENCWNDKIQALKVKVFNNKKEELNLPNLHITVSASKGIPPKLSKEMLLNNHESEPFNKSIIGTLFYDTF